jgi:Sortilin, neurotensin receptor 3,
MRRSKFGISLVGGALASALTVAPVWANGRFPRAQHLVESPSDPNRLVIAATFGLITTSDRGKSWYHICETAFAVQDNLNLDVLLALTADESMLVGVQSNLNVSHDHGCQWASSLQATKQTIADFTVAKSNASTVVAVVTTYLDGGTSSLVNESVDGGKTWKTVGTPFPAQVLYSIDVDPQDPTHIYATGLSKGAGVLLYSSDHAMNWASSPIPNTNLDEVPYIAAIHPQDPKKIFVRTDAWPEIDGINTGNDALLYSDDGGKVWTEVIRKGAKMLGFALSPDGSTVLAGYGDPLDSAQAVVAQDMGIYKSPTASFMFDRLADYSVTCLAWTKTGAYVCASQDSTDFDLAFSQDASFKPGGCGLVPLLRRQEIKGPPPACSGGAVNMCDWSMTCQVLDACDGGASSAAKGVDAGSCVLGTGGSPGTGGSSVPDASVQAGGNAMTTTGGAGGASTTEGIDVPKNRDSTGCACRVPGRSPSSGEGAACALFAALVSCSRYGSSRTRRRRTRAAPDRR